MIDKRIAAGFALVAGVGLASVAAAPVSGAATPPAAHHAAHAQTAAKGAGKGKARGGKRIVCVVRVGGPAGGKGGPVTLPPLPGLPGKGTAERIEVKVVHGKVTVYVNGKPAPAGSVHVGTGAGCPPPPGGVSVHPGEGGTVLQGAPGAAEAGLSTAGLRA
ncbi:hypothetical protein [Streptomyces sp. NPDC020983]|uniref:hypothetical protein n=1 Tax=Streptomyces sp. NPDC020983 TaxID=3365106 RepID=UPI00379E33D5